jgi:hypothetical protein
MAAEVQPICLPMDPLIRNKNYVRSNPFVAGWGATSFSECCLSFFSIEKYLFLSKLVLTDKG